MLATLGQIYLILAFTVAILTAMVLITGVFKHSVRLISCGRYGMLGICALYLLAMGVVIHAFIIKDFDFQIVFQHASSDLPAIYSFTSLYASKSGSIMFWGCMISILAALLTTQKFNKHSQIMPVTLLIMAIVQAFFLSLITLVTNVFEKSTGAPAEGMGLNPQLQNIGMLIHPPLLYLGFAGFIIVFAFVMGALFSRSAPQEWTSGIRRWTLFAWCMLGLGNLVGAWWAYNELDWGGYWAWDPVENAGLMPWLLGTGFVHSIVMVRKRDYLKGWSFSLVIFTFLFVLFSPFITHGGIESILHGFTGSPLPPYLLGAIIISLIGSLGLLFLRRDCLQSDETSAHLFSVPGAFLLINFILVIIVLLMISGTVFPRISEAFGERVSLDRDFFDLSCGPVLLILVFFMGICPLLRWRRTSFRPFTKSLSIPLGPAIIAAIAISITGTGNWYALATLVCGFVVLSIFSEWITKTQSRHRNRGENYFKAFASLLRSNRPRYGGFIVHIGIVLITLGVIGSSMYDVERIEVMEKGTTMSIAGYELKYEDLHIEHQKSKVEVSAAVAVSCDSHHVATLIPEREYYFNQMQSVGEAAIRTTVSEDLFVSLLDYDSDKGTATIRAMVNPLVIWMWIGGGIILLGGIIAFWPQRSKEIEEDAEILENMLTQ